MKNPASGFLLIYVFKLKVKNWNVAYSYSNLTGLYSHYFNIKTLMPSPLIGFNNWLIFFLIISQDWEGERTNASEKLQSL